MKPYIICHMVSSVDGKIDGAALIAVMGRGEYEATGAKLHGDAWICGRTTMQQHFAEDKPFVSPPRARRQGLALFLSLDAPSPMPSRLIRSASCGGQTVISTATTSSVW